MNSLVEMREGKRPLRGPRRRWEENHNIELKRVIFRVWTGLHIKWVPCHHGMARPQVADGGDGLQIWRVAAIE
jgi:hypothetical protein